MKTGALLLLLSLSLYGCGAFGRTTPTPLPTVALDAGGTTPQGALEAVAASGNVVPAQEAQLVFAMAGKVDTVNVAVGDRVEAGQVLAKLAGSDKLTAAIEAANLERLSAQQALDALQTSAAMATAQAQLAVAQAQSALNQAQKNLRNVQHPVGQALLDAVRDTRLALDTAQANLQLANVSPDVQAYLQAKVASDQAFTRYQALQARLDQDTGNDALREQTRQAEAAYQAAFDNMAALLLRIDTAKANQANAVAKAEAAYQTAENNLNAAQRGPEADRVALAEANVAVAQAALADAQAHYAKVQAGPDPDALALARSRLSSAEAQLVATQSAQDELELRAPSSGLVTDVRIHPGEWALPGAPMLVLSDLERLRVQTTDLSERDVPQVKIGQPVTVFIKALNQQVAGHVSAIAPLADTLGGDVVYTATIELDERPAGLRAGMSVTVQFEE